jgi:hypothetical protein
MTLAAYDARCALAERIARRDAQVKYTLFLNLPCGDGFSVTGYAPLERRASIRMRLVTEDNTQSAYLCTTYVPQISFVLRVALVGHDEKLCFHAPSGTARVVDPRDSSHKRAYMLVFVQDTTGDLKLLTREYHDGFDSSDSTDGDVIGQELFAWEMRAYLDDSKKFKTITLAHEPTRHAALFAAMLAAETERVLARLPVDVTIADEPAADGNAQVSERPIKRKSPSSAI